jgi:DNA-binding transcriptional ArsR family regulator
MNIKKSVKIFAALAQETRLLILKRLVSVGIEGLCPCHLVDEFNLTNANLSFHLKELENAGLLEKEKKGKFIHYRAKCSVIKELGDFLIEDCSKFNSCKNKEN